MGTKIVIELDNDGMLEDMDIQNDYLSEEKIAQGFAEGAGVFISSVFDFVEKDYFNHIIDVFLSSFAETLNIPADINSEADFESFMQAMTSVNLDDYTNEESRMDYYEAKKATLEAFEQAKTNNNKADNIRHLFGNKK